MVKKGKVSKKQSKKKASYDSEESIDDDGSQTGWNSDEDQIFYNDKDEDYDDDEEEGGILLSDLIGLNEAKQKAKIAGVSKGSSSKSSKQPQSETKKAASAPAPAPRPPVTFNSEDEDEDMESVEEMDNDFASEDDDDEEEDAAEGDEDDEDVDEDDSDGDEEEEDEDNSDFDEDEDSEADGRHSKLVNAINRFSNVDEDAQRQKQLQQHYAKLAESSVVGMSGSGGGLGLNALFDHIGDAAGLSAMKTQLKDLDKTSSAPKYVEKVHAARIEREETYAATKEDISKWQETVIANRSVGTLDLAQDKRRPHKAKTLVNSFVPTTDFEKEIQMVMLQHGASDAATEKKERELLEASNFTPEEIAARHAELAKVRALLFYEQMKRHRMNKIKSKAYRAIKRKQRQKLELEAEQMAAEVGDLNSDDDDGNGNAADKAALKRIRERMNLKHKNTSKWARMALKFGHTDKDLRDAYHESVRMGHDLTRKMDEDVGAGDASDDDGDAGGVYEDDEEDHGRATSNGGKAVARRAKRDLEALLSGDSAHAAAAAAVSGKYKKLFEMDFMKKAVDAQHERAREEAKEVLKELATLEGSELHSRFADESGDEDDHAQTLLSSAPLLTKKQTVTVVKAIGMPAAGTVATAAAPVVRWTQAAVAPAPATKPAATAKAPSAVADASEAPADNPWLDDRAAKSGAVRDARVAKKQSQTAAPGAITVSGVVSLQVPAKTSTAAPQSSKSASTKTKAAPTTAASEAPVASQKRKRSDSVSSSSGHVASSSKPDEPPTSNSNSQKTTATATAATKKQLIEQSQEELVKLAFAGPDYEADFQQQKDQEISRELGLNDKQTKVLRDGTLRCRLLARARVFACVLTGPLFVCCLCSQ